MHPSKTMCRRIILLLLILLVSPSLFAQSNQPNANTNDIAERIVGAAMTRGGAISFLEALTDTVGGRVTGSPESQAAADLILKTLRDAGYDNAHFEEFSMSPTWRRGPASAWVVSSVKQSSVKQSPAKQSPVKQPIFIGSYGWSPGTKGRVEIPLITVTATADGKLSKDPASLSGAAALVTIEMGASANTFAADYVVLRSRTARQLASAGAVAMLIPSEKPDRMLYTSGAGIYPRAPLPMLSVAKEDTLFLRRLLAKGEVKIALDVQNTFDESQARERNVIADLPGSSLPGSSLPGSSPENVVLVGAHFDSWDPAQGADDNGSGVAAVLEAARVLKSLNVKTKATIRFAFFAGEEQACLGSRAYIATHKNELDHLWAAIIMDNGALRPTGFSLHGRDDLEAALKQRLAPMGPFGAAGILTGGDLYSDDETFVVAGVPSLSLEVVASDYDNRHHTIIDTFDKIDPQALDLDTAALALASYYIANADQSPGRRLSRQEVDRLLKKTGQSEYVDLDFSTAEKQH